MLYNNRVADAGINSLIGVFIRLPTHASNSSTALLKLAGPREKKARPLFIRGGRSLLPVC
jgi:hypothetical protein